MNNDERQMIADLFERMRTVQNLDKDGDAEAFIHQSMRENANSPYLLVQSVLAQEVALQEAGKRIEELEAQQGAAGASGGRQSVGFGGGAVPAGQAAPWESPANNAASTSSGAWGSAPAATSSVPATGGGPRRGADAARAPERGERGGRGGGFMAQAMTTAAGVAGGMLLANSIGSLFGGSSSSSTASTTSPTETAATDTAATEAQQPVDQADASGAEDQAGLQDASHDDGWGDDAGWGGDDDFGMGDFDI